MRKPLLLTAFLACALSQHAAIQMKWSATANETKKIYAITGNSYTINWGDGSSDNATSHTYTTAGEYTVEISGAVSTLDLRGDDSSTGASGITNFAITEADNTLNTLNIWGNSSLTSIDVKKASALQSINTTADPITELDLSGNTALTSIDLKLCSKLTDLTVASIYANLTTVDVNNSALTACSLNALFNALPSASGTLYTTSCTGDATSDPNIAKNKGWTFGNGGTGDASAVCSDPLGAVSNVQSTKLSGTNNYSITWNEATSAESYSIRYFNVADSSLCGAQYAFSTGLSVNLNDIETPTDIRYYVYSIKGNSFVKSGPYTLNDTQTCVANIKASNKIVAYTSGNTITVCNAAKGDEVKLYGINGTLLGVKTSDGSDITFRANNGNYIITAGKETLKVSVLDK